MYAPSHFAENRVEVLHEIIERAGLFTLVTTGADGLDASHIPMLLDAKVGPNGRLLGHLARPNGQWKAAADGSPALAIVLGPDAYVSPSWYQTKREAGRVVPTWNYVAVHIQGVVRFFHDRDRLLDLVQRLTDRQEHGRAPPWKVSDAPRDYVDAMLKGIVGFELAITRIEGKWKASQNRSAEDQLGVIHGMRQDGHEDMARVMDAVTRPER